MRCELLGPQASAQMTIAMRICMTGMGMLTVIAQPLWPAFADAAHRADHQWVMHKLAWGMALLTGVTVLGSVILLALGRDSAEAVAACGPGNRDRAAVGGCSVDCRASAVSGAA